MVSVSVSGFSFGFRSRVLVSGFSFQFWLQVSLSGFIFRFWFWFGVLVSGLSLGIWCGVWFLVSGACLIFFLEAHQIVLTTLMRDIPNDKCALSRRHHVYILFLTISGMHHTIDIYISPFVVGMLFIAYFGIFFLSLNETPKNINHTFLAPMGLSQNTSEYFGYLADENKIVKASNIHNINLLIKLNTYFVISPTKSESGYITFSLSKKFLNLKFIYFSTIV